MVTETAEVYRKAVLPWIEAQPTSRIQWIYNILSGLKETENVLFRDDDPDTGFIVLPDRYPGVTTQNSVGTGLLPKQSLTVHFHTASGIGARSRRSIF